MRRIRILGALFAAALALSAAPTAASDGPPPSRDSNTDTFSPNEIVQAGSDFFGVTTEVMAKAVQRVTEDLGLPDGYIKGDEGSGAFILGVRYGSGWLIRKGEEPIKVYWKGPSVGFDFGGNGSKVFTLVYNLKRVYESERGARLYQRFSGRRGQHLFRRRHRRELSALRRRDAGADAHRHGPARRRQRALHGLQRPARLVPALSLQATASPVLAPGAPAGAGR